MKVRYFVFVIAATMASLLFVGSSSATVSPMSVMLVDSSPSALSSSTQIMDKSGDYMVSSAALDTTVSTATIGSDGYLCGNVQYRATIRGYNFAGWVMWTYRSTFGVHVCHNKVGYKTALYDEPMDTFFGWSWCGNIVRSWTMAPYNKSAASYTKGCFDLISKYTTANYPWARMTIGGNGGLWVRKTGYTA